MLFRALLSVVASAIVLTSAAASSLPSREEYEVSFKAWMQQHNIKFDTSKKYVHALDNWIDNDKFINDHNSDTTASYQLGHNQFSHMNEEEWQAFIATNLPRPNLKTEGTHRAPTDLSVLPPSMDWVTLGAVTPVKNQGSCGGCWAFSATGAIEGASKIKYGTLNSLSEQNILDCDTGGTDKGCNGGWMDSAFGWVGQNGGICSEDAYPYVSGNTSVTYTCAQTNCTIVANSAPTSFVDVQHNSDDALMSALAQQPVSVAIQASQKSFQLYKGGVFVAPCGAKLDHGVLAVGYGKRGKINYYKVKNSWGTSWGEGGYILLQRGTPQKAGKCGILSAASYPVL